MDNGSEKHPIRDSANESMRPGFLGGKGGGETPGEGKINLSRDAANELNENEKVAASTPNVTGVKQAESMGGGFFSGKGRDISNTKPGLDKWKILKRSSAAVFPILILVACFAVVGTPISMLAGIDYNLMNATGITYTSSALKEQGEYVEQEMALEGKFPSGLANDLAANGIDVGQVMASGDFVRTNEYIADIDKLDDIAVVGSGFEMHQTEEGQLAFLFEGEVVRAEDFVAKVRSNPKLYAANTNATDLPAKYYYNTSYGSSDRKTVDSVFKALGIKRWAFQNWEPTGDSEKDQENFWEIEKSILDGESSVNGGYDCSIDNGCSEASLTGDAADIVGGLASDSESGAQLLNSASTAQESLKAMRACAAVEIPIQMVRINENGGPGNEIMTVLYDDSNEVTYVDVNTGEEVTSGASIIETYNFAATVSGGAISKEEAANFSNDRILKTAGVNGDGVIKSTEVSTTDGRKSNIGVGSFSSNRANLGNTKNNVQIALSESNSNTFPTIIGGNYIPRGCMELNSTLNQHALGAMPSDKNVVLAYVHDRDERLAFEAKMERANKSPFDISSPYTFMGSIVRGLSNALIQNSTGKGSLGTMMGAAATLADNSVKELTGVATADGEGSSLLTTFGDICKTAPSAGSAADAWCTQENTIYTGLMKNTAKDWGNIGDKKEYKDWVIDGMGSWAPVGVENQEVCKRWWGDGLAADLVSALFGACVGVTEDIATGSRYVMNGDSAKIKEYSAFTLYDTVKALLSDSKSKAEVIMDEYYAEHPLDNSYTGIIARMSGMTKEQTEIAFNYADYLNEIAAYDASDRYVFDGVTLKMPEKGVLVEHSEKINGDLYCFWRGRNEYGDVRNRNFA